MAFISTIPAFDAADLATAGLRFKTWTSHLDNYFAVGNIMEAKQKVASCYLTSFWR